MQFLDGAVRCTRPNRDTDGTSVSLQLQRLVIIEWLGDEDEKTGKSLLDHLHRRRRDLPVEYLKCGSRGDVFEALTAVTGTVAVKGIPVVHIEAHGYVIDGVGLGFSGPGKFSKTEAILWRELEEPLRALNLATEFNLVVVAAACLSESLLFSIKSDHVAPFVATVAFMTEVAWIRLERAMIAFYDALFIQKQRIDLCLDRAKAELGADERLGMSFLPLLLDGVGREIIEAHSTKEAFEDRYRKSNLHRVLRNQPPESRIEALRRFDNLVGSTMDKTFGRILAYDLLPKNRERFGLNPDLYVAQMRRGRRWSV